MRQVLDLTADAFVFFGKGGERMQTGEKHYNIIFPIWLLWLFPPAWLFVLPANYLIDWAVLRLTMRRLRIVDARAKARTAAWRAWLVGLGADFVGTLAMFLPNLLGTDPSTTFGRWMMDNIVNAVSYNPFQTGAAFGYTTACLLLSAGLIYLGNSRWGLKKALAQAKERKTAAAALAVFTAPYLFYLPTQWFF